MLAGRARQRESSRLFQRSPPADPVSTIQAPTEHALSDDLAGWGRVRSFLWTKPGIFRRLVPGYLASVRPIHPDDLSVLVQEPT